MQINQQITFYSCYDTLGYILRFKMPSPATQQIVYVNEVQSKFLEYQKLYFYGLSNAAVNGEASAQSFAHTGEYIIAAAVGSTSGSTIRPYLAVIIAALLFLGIRFFIFLNRNKRNFSIMRLNIISLAIPAMDQTSNLKRFVSIVFVGLLGPILGRDPITTLNVFWQYVL